MPRIAGQDLPNKKHVVIALTAIFGIGNARAKDICKATNINPETKASDLTNDEVNNLQAAVKKYTVEGDLRRKVAKDISDLQGSYRGMRHKRRLPCRGQRTRTNARTRKGKKGGKVGSKKQDKAA